MTARDPLAAAALQRWIRRQLRQRTPEREHLEAAVANDDPEEFRRILARSPFSNAQRRALADLLRRWEDRTSAGGA